MDVAPVGPSGDTARQDDTGDTLFAKQAFDCRKIADTDGNRFETIEIVIGFIGERQNEWRFAGLLRCLRDIER